MLASNVKVEEGEEKLSLPELDLMPKSDSHLLPFPVPELEPQAPL